ncbi:MAG TPA: TonB-dependent receptor, partial [Gammaproteobacteria bacterium]|nr:TonB-dependent receptor [Gammaproteobacteria bacterium]
MAIFHCASFRLISLLGLLAALLTTYSGGVFAASAGSADAVIEEVVVTGSFIKGTPIDSASPVTVIDREGLLRQGSPSVVEMVRRITASSGVDGETNQFQSNQSEGVASVNIRGLGAHRTLVLMNGRRQ